MPAIAIIGAQWGDEGKGKATDVLGSRVDYVVKFNGGNNAGHTVVIGQGEPSRSTPCTCCPAASSRPGACPVIGNGVVVDLGVLFEEIDGLEERGVDTSLLKVSASAHVIASYNKTLDKVTERFLGSRRLGTTGRGIGPTYADKMNRIGIRIQDLFDEKILQAKVEGVLELKNQVLTKIYNRRAPSVEEIVDELASYADRLAPYVVDSGLLLNQALDRGETVLLEAGQATLLDVDHGTYPFVTSSSATAGGACTGLGHPADPAGPRDRHREGLHDPRRRGTVPDRAGRRLRRAPAQGRHGVRHHDRPAASLRLVRHGDRALRRSGQRRHRLRAHQARRAHRARAGPGLRGLRRRRHAARRDAGQPVRLPPRRTCLRVPPRLVEDITGARTVEELPANARAYVERVEQLSGARISAIGVGPARTRRSSSTTCCSGRSIPRGREADHVN